MTDQFTLDPIYHCVQLFAANLICNMSNPMTVFCVEKILVMATDNSSDITEEVFCILSYA